MPGKKESDNGRKMIARNKKAFHDYFIDETFEVGIELVGTEVRSLRDNNCQLRDCYAQVKKGECWLYGVHIAPFAQGNIANVDPDRRRKLLLHKKQIRYLEQKTKERGFSLVPTEMYFSENGLVKLTLGLARGKHSYDKRDSIAARDSQRDIDRAMKERSRF